MFGHVNEFYSHNSTHCSSRPTLIAIYAVSGPLVCVVCEHRSMAEALIRGFEGLHVQVYVVNATKITLTLQHSNTAVAIHGGYTDVENLADELV